MALYNSIAKGLAAAAAGVASAVGKAVSNAKKDSKSSGGSSASTSSSSSSSSASSSGGSSSSSTGDGYTRYGDYTSSSNGVNWGLTSSEQAALLKQAQANSAAWADADEAGKQQLHDQNVAIYQQLGYNYDDKTGTWSPGGLTGGVNIAVQNNDQYQQAMDAIAQQQTQIDDYYAQQQAQIEAANKAAVEQAVSSLNAQKDAVGLAGRQSNAAAEQAYMQAINPNGSLAENLAAAGLLSSGITESSQISAGNAYQNALNANNVMVQEQLAEIERAITQAQLEGDLATAEALAAQYDSLIAQINTNVDRTLSQMNSNIDRLTSLAQWGAEYDASQKLNTAQLTGYYNGEETMALQQLRQQLALGEITYQQYLEELENMKLQNEAQKYNNQYLKSQVGG